jgi:hypothetical protein
VPRLAERAIRSHFHTSFCGSESVMDSFKRYLRRIDFSPEVFKKIKDSARPKGVDIALTKDMQSHGFRDN